MARVAGRVPFRGRPPSRSTPNTRAFQKLWAIPGVIRHQTGDAEMRAVLTAESLEQVAAVIRAKRWGGTGSGRPQNFSLTPGQPATSRRSEARLPQGQGERRGSLGSRGIAAVTATSSDAAYSSGLPLAK
jgi:hypothetical protein